MANKRCAWIGGNWKCNGAKESNSSRLEQLNQAPLPASSVDVVIFPTFIHIDNAVNTLSANYVVGAQNCSITNDGAFTGEVSAAMLKDIGATWVLCGHSERRQLYGETNEIVADKMAKVLSTGLKAVVCIGETLEERQAGKTLEVCKTQLGAIFAKVSDWSKIVIAYEPIWAIGTGVVASPETAQEVHEELRNLLSKEVSAEVASATRIVYGGSVNAANSTDLISKADIDGFLVGGASLKPEFAQIVKNVSEFYEKS
uniref:Triosephosphate isomerase n=1 Tax=Nephromyces sp. MMRI TaxID=2496275 RepID=A0A3Q8UBM6_9APIC|nr:triosephosphate isomerase [Nephromyces sp. MMRI]